VLGEIDLAHATLADLPQDAVSAANQLIRLRLLHGA